MPNLIYSSLNYFGDAEYPMDAGISVIKRIREELDPLFVPIFRLQVWRWEDGSTKKFKSFGWGLGESGCVNMPKDPDLADALKPCGSGYLGKLERAGRVNIWLPFDGNKDGTPGNTEPPAVWWYYMQRESFEYQRKLVIESRMKGVSQGHVARTVHGKAQDEANKNLSTATKLQADKDFAPDKQRIKQRIKDMTSSEFAEFRAEQKGWKKPDPKPFVHLGTIGK